LFPAYLSIHGTATALQVPLWPPHIRRGQKNEGQKNEADKMAVRAASIFLALIFQSEWLLFSG
jgi:hypothetical protein